MKFNIKKFKDRIKEERKIKGLRQDEFAKEISIARASASYYENQNNSSLPNAATLYKMANFFNVSADYLLGLTDAKKPAVWINEKESLIKRIAFELSDLR